MLRYLLFCNGRAHVILTRIQFTYAFRLIFTFRKKPIKPMQKGERERERERQFLSRIKCISDVRNYRFVIILVLYDNKLHKWTKNNEIHNLTSGIMC